MKTCQKCKQQKHCEEFLKTSNTTKGSGAIQGSLCRPCREALRTYNREYYHKNADRKAAVIKRANRVSVTKKDEGRAIVLAAKSVPCTDCLKSYPPYVMDFDHTRGQKLFTISHWGIGSKNIERLIQEIAKCDVVCSNCHRQRTHARAQTSVAETGAAPVTQT